VGVVRERSDMSLEPRESQMFDDLRPEARRRVLATTLERGVDLVEVLAAVVGAYGVERAVGGAR